MEKDFLKIKRNVYLQKIKHFYYSKYIKVITGIRRSGKSELLNQIKSDLLNDGVKPEQIISFDLESEQYFNIKTGKQLFSLLHKRITNNDLYFIFIDEIQRINKFEAVIAAIRTSYNCSLFVTGSNSRLLHGKLQDRLTGRAKEFEILPFSFSEVLEFKKINNLEIKPLNEEFNDYLMFGGMPQIFEEHDNNGKVEYLNSLFSSIIHKDAFERHKRIDKELFLKLSKYIISSSGKTFSALSIAKQLKQQFKINNIKSFSKNINDYANFLIESYFVKECRPHETGTKRSVLGMRKFYDIDNGFKYALNNPESFDITFALENTIYNELLYQGFSVYYAKHNGVDIDFIAFKNQKPYLIQVTYSLANLENCKREFKPFDSFKSISNKYILSLDTLDMSKDGVKHINILNFLTHKFDWGNL